MLDFRRVLGLAAALFAASLPSAFAAGGGSGASGVSDAVVPVISPPLSELPLSTSPAHVEQERENRQLPHHPLPALAPRPVDPVVQTRFGKSGPTPTGVNFDGIAADGVAPPDTNGRVGPNHFIEWVNAKFAVYSKTGTLLFGPADGNTLFTALGGTCASHNDGDPIAQYDLLADRWVLTQFAVDVSPPSISHQCVAVSVTGNPLGSWYLYDFPTSTNLFVDYPHFGMWPDGYYMTSHLFDGTGSLYMGQGLHVFERDRMLAGLPARSVFVNLGNAFGGALPADLDSLTPPPAGSPNFIVAPGAPALDGSGSPMLHVWKAAVTWGASPSLTITGPTNVLTASFDPEVCGGFNRQCVPEPAPAVDPDDYLDAISDRNMYRIGYRNFGSHESLVLNHTVKAGGGQAGVRWYELRSPATSPTIFQQSTFAPDSAYRWMGSIAMDNSGDIALGYSKSSTSVFPSIAVTGRLVGDAAGTLGSEVSMMAGSGSQLGTFNRWGDYSAMTVDPRDGCTFWYTNQYIPSNGSFNWRTRIASFAFPSCVAPAQGTISGTVTDGTNPIVNALVVVSNGYSGATDGSGHYSIVLPPGSYSVFAETNFCGSSAPVNVTVSSSGVTSQNFTISTGPGFALGTISIDDSPGNANGRINKNECVRLTLPLHNLGCAAGSSIVGTLTTTTPGVTVGQPTSSYPNLAVSATGSNAVPFQITTSSSFVCGTPILFTLTVQTSTRAQAIDFSLPTCSPTLTFTGAIAGTDSSQTGRLNRFAPSATCPSKPCPGLLTATGARNYDMYTFTNTAATARCVTITTTTPCSGSGAGSDFIFPVAYLGSFNPASLCTNYLGDPGLSPNPANNFEVSIPAGQTVALVVHAVPIGGTCSSYTVTVDGLLDVSDGGGGDDLSLTNVDSVDPVLVGTNVTYTVSVTNNGTSSASNVTVVDTLPSGSVVSVTPSAGSCSGTSTRTCNFGTLAASASATLTIVMTAPGTPGTMTNVASVSATGCDPDLTNNAATQTTTVVGPLSPAALSVDGAAASGTSSNTNGVLEPGETVLLKPSWMNNTGSASSSFTGAGSNAAGPPGATYGLPDAAASYGSLAAGAAGDCGSNCYQFSVSNPATRPAAHWDASFDETLSTSASKNWVLHVGKSFGDVAASSGFNRFIETLFHNGVTGGCGGGNYCPASNVSRQQMAVFLLVSKEGAGYSPPACVTPIFADVPCSSGFARWINELFNRGVTGGCGGGNYCPTADATRAQMAVFLLRTLEGISYTPPACVTPVFGDVPCSSGFAPWINELSARGITGGCGGGNFCPNSPNTRGQMAVFLTTTFGLTLYGP